MISSHQIYCKYCLRPGNTHKDCEKEVKAFQPSRLTRLLAGYHNMKLLEEIVRAYFIFFRTFGPVLISFGIYFLFFLWLPLITVIILFPNFIAGDLGYYVITSTCLSTIIGIMIYRRSWMPRTFKHSIRTLAIINFFLIIFNNGLLPKNHLLVSVMIMAWIYYKHLERDLQHAYRQYRHRRAQGE